MDWGKIISILSNAKRSVEKFTLHIASALIIILFFSPIVLDKILTAQGIDILYFRLLIISGLIWLLIDHVVKLQKPESKVDIVHPNNNRTSITDYVAKNPPETLIAIQYSAGSIWSFLEDVINKHKCKITLYLHDPRRIPKQDRQRGLMFIAYTELLRISKEKPNFLEIYYYTSPPSMRAMAFDDNFFSVGWYVQWPLDDELLVNEIRGHNKPHINAYKSTPEGQIISKMFHDQLQELEKYRIKASDVDVSTWYEKKE